MLFDQATKGSNQPWQALLRGRPLNVWGSGAKKNRHESCQKKSFPEIRTMPHSKMIDGWPLTFLGKILISLTRIISTPFQVSHFWYCLVLFCTHENGSFEAPFWSLPFSSVEKYYTGHALCTHFKMPCLRFVDTNMVNICHSWKVMKLNEANLYCKTLNFRDTNFSRIWPLGHFWTSNTPILLYRGGFQLPASF